MKKLRRFILPAAIILLAGAAALLLYFHLHTQTPPAESPSAQEKTEPGHLTLTPEQAKNAGLKTQQLTASTLQPTLQLFGALQEDPGASFTLRSQAAGLVEDLPQKPWPGIGDLLPDDTEIGKLIVRPVPADLIAIDTQRIALETQVATAKADAATANASLDAARIAYERLKKLNAEDQNVSNRAVEDALAKLKTEQSRLQGAHQTLDLASTALRNLQTAQATPKEKPLTISRGGEVVEVAVHPGEAVESGQAILRVSRFDSALAALEVPTGASISPDSKNATITPLAHPIQLHATRIGTAPATDPKTKAQIVMFRIPLNNSLPTLRPGTPVTALVPVPGQSLTGITVPASAVVRYLGKSWLYIANSPTTFQRREITLDHHAANGKDWFILQNLKPGEQIVTTGAAVLLSIEINAALGAPGD